MLFFYIYIMGCASNLKVMAEQISLSFLNTCCQSFYLHSDICFQLFYSSPNLSIFATVFLFSLFLLCGGGILFYFSRGASSPPSSASSVNQE